MRFLRILELFTLIAASHTASIGYAPAQLDAAWTVTVNGQTVPVRADGSFLIPNVSTPDNFGPNGPGSPPDGLGDDFVRVIGRTTVNGITRYALSAPFQISSGQTYTVSSLTVTDTPPPMPESIRIAVGTQLLNGLGATTQATVTATLPGGATSDVTPRTAWTTYRTSNAAIATVGPDGLVTATGPGVAFITALNDGASSVVAVRVSGSAVTTTVEGRVLDTQSAAVPGAGIYVLAANVATSQGDGTFSAPNIPTDQGNLVATAIATQGYGQSAPVAPVPNGITDVGDIVVQPGGSGRQFALCFQENYRGRGALQLFLSSDLPTTGTVDIPGLLWQQTFSITPGQVTTVAIPSGTGTGAMVTTGDGVEPKAIYVQAQDPVNVYGLNQQTWTTDGFTALSTNRAGTRYRVMAYAGGLPELTVVALQSNTTVTITPSNTAGSRPAGQPFNQTLQYGEVYQLQGGSDLTGSLITADLPVAVFGGNECCDVPFGVRSCDHLTEAMLPVNAWGTTYFTRSLAGRASGDTFRFLADANSTVVDIVGVEQITLQAGQFAERVLDGVHEIRASAPVLVAQYANGVGWDYRTGDPFLMLLSPSSAWQRRFTFTSPAAGFAAHYVNLIVPANDLTTVLLDGVPIQPLAADPIGSSGLLGVQIAVAAGDHVVTAPNPIALYGYGFALADSYAFTGGL